MMYKKICISLLPLLMLGDMPSFGMTRTLRNRAAAHGASRLARAFATRLSPFTRFRTVPKMRYIAHESNGHQRKKYFNFFEHHARGIVATLGALGVGTVLYKAYSEQPEPVTFENTFGLRPFERQRRSYYEYLLFKPWGAVAKKYIDEFEQEEKALCQEWRDICTELYKKVPCVISYKDFCYQELSAQEKEELFSSQEERSKTYQQYTAMQNFSTIWELLKKFDMKHVLVKPLDDEILKKIKDRFGSSMIAAPAAAATYANSGFCYRQPTIIYDVSLPAHNWFKALIMHEIQHLLHGDPAAGGIIKSVLDNLPAACVHEKKIVDAFCYKFSRFRERRADILGSLAALEYAQAMQAHWWFPWPLSKITDSFWPSKEHATPTVQYNYFKKLSDEMAQAQKEHRGQGTDESWFGVLPTWK